MKESEVKELEAVSAPVAARPTAAVPSPRFLRALAGPLGGCAWIARSLVRHPVRFLAVVGLLALIGFGAALAGAQVWTWYHFRAGRSALEHYHDAEAREHLQICLDVWPRDGTTLLLAARAARRLGRFDEAEQCLEQFQLVQPQTDELILERTLLHAERGEVDGVTRFCQAEMASSGPATPLILEAMTHGCLRMYRLQEAGDYLTRWLELQPDNPQALWFQGQLNDFHSKSQDAIASYNRVVELDPERVDARSRLCILLLDRSQPNEALPHLKWLWQRQPNEPHVQVYLARCRDQLGQVEEAKRLLDDVLARQPRFPDALAERGKLALREGQEEAAEKWLRQACDLDSGNYALHYQLYQCLTQRGQMAEARKLAEQLKQIENDMKRIEEIVNVKMQQNPHDAKLHYEAAMISMRAGAPAEGFRWLQSALQEDPKHAPTHRALAAYYQQTGQLRGAARHRRLAEQYGHADQPAPAGTSQ